MHAVNNYVTITVVNVADANGEMSILNVWGKLTNIDEGKMHTARSTTETVDVSLKVGKRVVNLGLCMRRIINILNQTHLLNVGSGVD